MDCKDLMIGDLVQFDEDTCVVEELRVDGTAVVTSLNTDLTSIDGDQVDVEELYPIPLTGDILVKNGFKKQEDVNEWSYYKSKDGKGQYMILWSMDYNYLEIGSYTGEFGEFNRMGIMRYVHQLQHALRLCGIEKELVID